MLPSYFLFLNYVNWIIRKLFMFIILVTTFLGVVAAFFILLRIIFGTFSLSNIYRKYTLKWKLEKRYLQMFTQREMLMYHISWAKVVR